MTASHTCPPCVYCGSATGPFVMAAEEGPIALCADCGALVLTKLKALVHIPTGDPAGDVGPASGLSRLHRRQRGVLSAVFPRRRGRDHLQADLLPYRGRVRNVETRPGSAAAERVLTTSTAQDKGAN